MKQQLDRVAKRIDALTLRERVIIFITAAFAMLFLVNVFLINPQFEKQKKLAQDIREKQLRINEIQAVIQQKLVSNTIDPDRDSRARLQDLKQQYLQTKSGLADLQKGLVSPDKMTAFLEDILKRHGQLQLTSLKTLPVALLIDSASAKTKLNAAESATASLQSNVPSNAVPSGAGSLIYQHGVEITVQGSFHDMLQYMSELESMPWQLFWSKAQLHVDTYPKATLTLTVFTLSLDKKWLNL